MFTIGIKIENGTIKRHLLDILNASDIKKIKIFDY